MEAVRFIAERYEGMYTAGLGSFNYEPCFAALVLAVSDSRYLKVS